MQTSSTVFTRSRLSRKRPYLAVRPVRYLVWSKINVFTTCSQQNRANVVELCLTRFIGHAGDACIELCYEQYRAGSCSRCSCMHGCTAASASFEDCIADACTFANGAEFVHTLEPEHFGHGLTCQAPDLCANQDMQDGCSYGCLASMLSQPAVPPFALPLPPPPPPVNAPPNIVSFRDLQMNVCYRLGSRRRT
eukprot:SAG11_NODE_3131_length_2664_cov_5.587914_3_plen_193_part_00